MCTARNHVIHSIPGLHVLLRPHLASPPKSNTTNNNTHHRRPKASPKRSPKSLQRRDPRRDPNASLRVVRNLSGNDSRDGQAQTVAQLCHCVEDAAGERLALGGEVGRDHNVADAEEEVGAHDAEDHGGKSGGPVGPVWVLQGKK